jgi:hypothetical protein
MAEICTKFAYEVLGHLVGCLERASEERVGEGPLAATVEPQFCR